MAVLGAGVNVAQDFETLDTWQFQNHAVQTPLLQQRQGFLGGGNRRHFNLIRFQHIREVFPLVRLGANQQDLLGGRLHRFLEFVENFLKSFFGDGLGQESQGPLPETPQDLLLIGGDDFHGNVASRKVVFKVG